MRRIFIIAFFWLGWTHVVFPQDYYYSTRNYTAVDGIPQSQVSAMVEDQNGYIWLGTQGGGLARFDGREFKVYTTLDGLLTNEIMGLKLDTHQNLWIVHSTGVTCFDGLHFKKFQEPYSPTSTKWFKKIYENQDTIFVLSNAGALSKIYNDSLYYWEKPIGKDQKIWRVHVAPGGEICLFLYDGSFVIQSKNDSYSFSPGFETGKIYNVFNYKQDVLMRSDFGLFRLDIKRKQVEKFSLPTESYVMLYDEKLNVFWANNGGTLIKESIKENEVKRDTVLRDVEIGQVMNDSEGNTWFASSGRGLFKYFIQDFDRCSSERLNGVMAILKDDDGTSWIGTMTKGLWKIKKGKIRSYVDKEMPYRNSIHSVKQGPDGTVWVATGFGLGRYNKDKDSFSWITRDDGLPGVSVMNIDFDNHHGIWIGTGNGLSYYDGKSFKNYSMKDGLSNNVIWATHYSKKFNALFVGTNMGANIVKNGKINSLRIEGLQNTAVTSIESYEDSLLLIGTAGIGLSIFNPATNGNKFITSHEGLSSDLLYFSAPDEKNYIWIGTEKGIDRIKLNSDFEITESHHYGYDNGLTGVETNQNAYYLSPKEKYFGLIDGLYQFNDLDTKKGKSFALHLTDVALLNGEYSSRQYADSLMGFFKIPFKPTLPPDRNHITFHFNRVDKRHPKSIKFKYQLENFDKTWSQPSFTNQVTYSNLPPGDYVFRVQATNSQGNWDEGQIVYEFTVNSPFYQTASFIVGMLILLAGTITLILYLRVKQRINRAIELERIRTKEQEALRKEIARDFHDEMGNQLTRIINYVSLLKLNGSSGYNHNDLYGKVEASAKYLYNGTRDFIWAIDPVNDELSKLFIHIRDFGEKLFEEKGINFRAFNDIKEKVKLPYGFSREANLIFKEAMTNAFKYSEAKNVSLTLRRENEDFEMIFDDDGIGFYTGDIEKMNGLQNIRERADRVNAILRIHSVKNHGTKIVLNFKLNKTLKYGLTL